MSDNQHAKDPRPRGTRRSSLLNRRTFAAAVGGAAISAGLAGVLRTRSYGAPKPDSGEGPAVTRLFKTLSDAQRQEIALPWEDPRRTKIGANWHVTKATIGTLSEPQRAIVHEIVQGVTSRDGYERILRQTKDDDGGLEEYAVAIFGTPGEAKSTFLLTGRHLTLRADENTTDQTAFGGPLVYGHGETNPGKNLFHYQTKRANEVFQALEGKQREQALLGRAPAETAVEIVDARLKRPGISLGDLSSDQCELVKKVVADILAPYRRADVAEALSLIDLGGGWEKLNFAFYQQGDLESDSVWDVWRIEGPTFIAHFRGAPHVHAYLNIAKV